MSRSPDLREIPEPPEEIQQAALDGDLVFFVGSGVSMLVGLPSWGSLASKALEELRQKGCLNYSKLEQLKGLEPKKLLSIAELIAKESSISLELPKFLDIGERDKGIYAYLNKIGCACVTTNYDELLEPQFNQTRTYAFTNKYSVTENLVREAFCSYQDMCSLIRLISNFKKARNEANIWVS